MTDKAIDNKSSERESLGVALDSCIAQNPEAAQVALKDVIQSKFTTALATPKTD